MTYGGIAKQTATRLFTPSTVAVWLAYGVAAKALLSLLLHSRANLCKEIVKRINDRAGLGTAFGEDMH